MKKLSLKDVVKNALKEQGYDGLFNEDADCACELSDLFPCYSPSAECLAGYKSPCPSSCGEHDWHISATKKE
jgi:hypothetical protein